MNIATAKLADIAEINPRFHNWATDDDEEVAFVPMAAVSAENACIETADRRSLSAVLNGFTYFQNGDILVAKITPCFENGKIAQARIAQRYGFGSTEFHVVRPVPGKLDARYLLHFLRQPRIRVEGERKMTGSAGQRRVPKNFIENLEIQIPPLEEQRRLASILDQAELLRSKRRRTLNKLDTLTRSLFLDLFGNPLLNTRQWPLRRFDEIGELDRGISKNRPRNSPELLGGPYPLIQTGDITNSDGYVRSYTSTYSELGLQQSKMWPSGTLCITIAANIGRTAILTFDACFPDSVVGFRANESVRSEFIQTWLSFLQKRLEETAPQVAQKNINLGTLRNLDVPLPPLELQNEFVRRVNSAKELRAKQTVSLAKLDALFASLQHRAFRGEL